MSSQYERDAKARREAEIKTEAERILSFLAGMPSGITTAIAPVVRHLLLSTDGQIVAGGRCYEIKAKNIGAGVYRLTLAEVAS